MQPSTPGVYTIEKNAFPNSVVEVATAIPAFIGYTERALRQGQPIGPSSPTRIESLKQFEDHFGGPFAQTFKLQQQASDAPAPRRDQTGQQAGVVHLSESDPQATALLLEPTTIPFYLYSAVRLFYLNGGSTCYIVSLGSYQEGATPDPELFKPAMVALTYEQDPTMLLCPDALRLNDDNYYNVAQQMLTHCADTQSRVALFDVAGGSVTRPIDVGPVIDAFRTKVGQNNLKYGTAYFPWVETTVFADSQVSFTSLSEPSLLLLKGLLNPDGPDASAAPSNIVAEVEKLRATAVKDAAAAESADKNAKTERAQALTAVAKAAKALDDSNTAEAANEKLLETAQAKLAEQKNLTKPNDAAITNATRDVKDAQEKIDNSNVDHLKQVATKAKADATKALAEAEAAESVADGLHAVAQASLQAVSTALSGTANASTKKVRALDSDVNETENIFDQAIELLALGQDRKPMDAKAVAGLLKLKDESPAPFEALRDRRQAINNALLALFPAYKLVLRAVAKYLNTMPVAPAMAGVYTAIDSSRGVWKAPANVSLNAVVAPTVSLSDKDQGTLNIHPETGKSVNAIRAFRGLGTLVWGARTLDGNSQDWRYVNVRRTMIMIEQSVKMAARAYVFEPNDANTWTTVKSMISSFLFNLWKQGALAGSVPTDAYSVQVGLGSTMTAQDILDGLMNVTVLVALVRPAEFIMLTFQQQLQKS